MGLQLGEDGLAPIEPGDAVARGEDPGRGVGLGSCVTFAIQDIYAMPGAPEYGSHYFPVPALAIDMTAFACIALQRARLRGDLGDLPVFTQEGVDLVEPLAEAIWYPDPLVPKDQFRFWDGTDWTDRMKILRNGRWLDDSSPLSVGPPPGLRS
jgi:hypothetical protein